MKKVVLSHQQLNTELGLPAIDDKVLTMDINQELRLDVDFKVDKVDASKIDIDEIDTHDKKHEDKEDVFKKLERQKVEFNHTENETVTSNVKKAKSIKLKSRYDSKKLLPPSKRMKAFKANPSLSKSSEYSQEFIQEKTRMEAFKGTANHQNEKIDAEREYLRELDCEKTRIENILLTQGYLKLPKASSTLCLPHLESSLSSDNSDDEIQSSTSSFTNVITAHNQQLINKKEVLSHRKTVTEETTEINSSSTVNLDPSIQNQMTDLSFGKILGVGGAGYVQLAWQHSLAREVAIKRISGDWKTSNKAKSLVREARLAGFLEHPNILPIHLLAQNEEGEPLIIMKRVEGQNWSEILKKEGALYLPKQGEVLVKNLKIFIQVCRALEYTHSRNVLHLDIKPENIMIGEYGEVYLVDWGVGMYEERLPQLAEHYIAGTPSFMASEMVQGLKYSSKASDIALLGSTLHYLLMGTYRYQGKDILNVLYQAGKAEAASYPFEVHTELAHIINKACHKNSEERFKSVYDLRCAIEAYLDHRSAFTLFHESFVMMKSLEQEIFTAFSTDQVEAFREKALTCRITLAHTLSIWPDYQEALRSLQLLLRLCCAFEIQQDNLTAAETYYNELIEDDHQLYQDLMQAKKSKQQQIQDHARLLDLEEDLSFKANHNLQWVSAVLHGLLWASCLSIFSYLNRNEIIPFTNELNLIASSWALGVMILIFFGLKSFFTDTQWRKKITILFICYLSILYLNRHLALLLEISVIQSLIQDALFLTFFLSALSILIHPVLWLSCFLCLLTTVMIPIYPLWALDFFALVVLLANISMALVLQRKFIQ
jgi:eukaryotic-like serine/threonine-protein kinase